MELRGILGKMAPPYSLMSFFTLVLLVEEAHYQKKWHHVITQHHFLQNRHHFILKLRERMGSTFFYFSQAIIGSSILFSMPPHSILLRKTWDQICSWRKGIFLGESPLVGGSSSTSNLKTCYNFNLCNIFYNVLKAF